MRVALINLPHKGNIIRRWRCAIEQSHYLFPPIELGYIAGALKKINAEILLIDCVAERENYKNLLIRLKNFAPKLIIFMPGFENIPEDLEGAVLLKKETGAKLCCFGYYPSIFDRRILERYDIDFIIRDEPEITITELCEAIRKNKPISKIAGVSYRLDDKIRKNKDRPPLKNLDSLPFPAREFLKNNLYYLAFPYKKPYTVIFTTRSCPFRCTYCIRSFGDVLRQRCVENVIDEIKECVEKYGIKTLWISDDTFTFNKSWVLEFCKGVIKNKIRIDWTCLSRPDTLDEEMLEKMKEAGCNRILLGIESGSKTILESCNRFYDLNKIKPLVEKMRTLGIQSFAFFMIGYPDETEGDIKKTIEFAKHINPDFITLNILRLYPGTKMFEQLERQKRASFNLFPYYAEVKTNTPEAKLKKWLFNIYRAFYFRPNYVLSHTLLMLKNIPTFFMLTLEYIKWEIYGRNIQETK